jgi:hypothetical protein
MHARYALSSFGDPLEQSATPRLALGGGSDQPPPSHDTRSAEIIPFPVERRRQAQDERAAHAPDGDAVAFPEASSAAGGSMWASWLDSVLSSDPLAGIRAG